MSGVIFTIRGKPHGKGATRRSRFGGVFTPEKTRSYLAVVSYHASEAMRSKAVLLEPLRVKIEAYLEVPASWSAKKQAQALNDEIKPAKKPDIDNIQKSVFDGCNGIVWRDDAQICSVEICKKYSIQPRVDVAVFEM